MPNRPDDADGFSHPHLLGVAELTRAEILAILDRADAYADRNAQHLDVAPALKTKTLINLFFENSTRTQASFELAAKRLGATVMNMSVKGSSVAKGETLLDTATTLNAMLPDILVVRHQDSGAVALLAEKVACSVVNAGDGWHEHPTQALLDALTMRRAFAARRGADSPAARLQNLTIAICGDVLHSRVARSNIFLHRVLGNQVRVAGPPTLMPSDVEGLGVEIRADLASAAEGADVVMMLRLQSERMSGAYISSTREHYHAYGLKAATLAEAAPDVLVMHPGPMNRGVEIDSDLADDAERSVIATQVEMGVAVRMAVLAMVAENGPPTEQRREPPPGGGDRGRFLSAASAAPPKAVLFRNARLVDPETGLEALGDLFMRGGRIEAVRPGGFGDEAVVAAETVACGGAALAPGLVDMRVFIGEPGARHRESFGSGGESAVAGGVTTIVTQPGTAPPVDDPALLDFIRQRVLAESVDHAMPNVLTMAALTRGLEGCEMAEFAFLKEAGAAALSDGDRTIADSRVLRRCLQTATALDMLVCCHTQDPHLSAGVCATEGLWALRRGLPAAPVEAETLLLERDLALVASTDAKYHASQISTVGSLEILTRARERGLDVSAAVSAPHASLSEDDIGAYRTFFKVDPPLRAERDRAAMAAALASGAVDCLVSSHQPQNEEAKRQPYAAAAAGAVGLETLLSAALGLRAETGMPLPKLFATISLNPARRLGLDCGRLAAGAPADLVLFDPDAAWTVDRRRLRSKSKNSPFHRMDMRGRVLRTVVGGRTVFAAVGAGDADKPGGFDNAAERGA